MDNKYNRGWLATYEKQALDLLCSNPNVVVYDEKQTADMIQKTSSESPIGATPAEMQAYNFENGRSVYDTLQVYFQDANNCAGHSIARAIEAYMMTKAYYATDKELLAFEVFVPWSWGAGKNQYGQCGTGGATIGAMWNFAASYGVLPCDIVGLPGYAGTSNKWARCFGKDSLNAPYAKYWDTASKYTIHIGLLKRDPELFKLSCKAGYPVSFGTSQRIKLSRDIWTASGSWMHAMAAYGYNEELDRPGIDNSHGDGFGWAPMNVVKNIVSARYFDACVILGMEARALPKPIYQTIIP